MFTRFADRKEAGRRLAMRLSAFAGRPDVIVLALPRGGVPVASEVARALGVPLNIWLVRKLGVPGHAELAMGAIAEGGLCELNTDLVSTLRIAKHEISAVIKRERAQLERMQHVYRGDRPCSTLHGRTVILVDDGLATGATMRVAVRAVRQQGAKRVIVAVPTAPPGACADMEHEADACVCVMTPEPFYAVGMSYDDFAPVSDQEVGELLDWSVGQEAVLLTP